MSESAYEGIEIETILDVPKREDINYRISRVDTPYGKFFDFREYVISSERWGRGVTMPDSPEVRVALGRLIGAIDVE